MAQEPKLGGRHGYFRDLKGKALEATLKAKELKTKELKGQESG